MVLGELLLVRSEAHVLMGTVTSPHLRYALPNVSPSSDAAAQRSFEAARKKAGMENL